MTKNVADIVFGSLRSKSSIKQRAELLESELDTFAKPLSRMVMLQQERLMELRQNGIDKFNSDRGMLAEIFGSSTDSEYVVDKIRRNSKRAMEDSFTMLIDASRNLVHLSKECPPVTGDKMLRAVDAIIKGNKKIIKNTESSLRKAPDHEAAVSAIAGFCKTCNNISRHIADLTMKMALSKMIEGLESVGPDFLLQSILQDGQMLFMPEQLSFGNRSQEILDVGGREEIKKIGDKLVDFLFENKINRVLFLDRSARPAYMAMRSAWIMKHPEVKTPEMYFTNPDGHDTKKRYPWHIDEEFVAAYKHLVADRSSPILIFDTCIHKGRTMSMVKGTLDRLKFKNTLVGLVQAVDKEDNCEIKPDFVALQKEAKHGCYPFTLELSVIKRDNVVSVRNDKLEKLEHSRLLRREIQEIFAVKKAKSRV